MYQKNIKKLRVSSLLVASAATFALLFSACTKKEETTTTNTTTEVTKVQEAPAAQASGAASAASQATDSNKKPEVQLAIGSDGDNMAFDKTELTAKPGSVVRLIFKNNVKTSGLQHNWVMTKPGTEADVSNLGTQAGADKGWIPDSPNVIAHTRLINAGEEDSIIFTAPPAGDYPFICTFPGHQTSMKGVFHSK